MGNGKLNYWVDVSLLVTFAITALIGIMMYIFLPCGVPQGGQRVFLGLMKETWVEIHIYFGFALVALGDIAFHTALELVHLYDNEKEKV